MPNAWNDGERKRVNDLATRWLDEAPLTITSVRCEKGAGGLHDYHSEGDYWWPDPANPDAPYIRRDGLSFPARFEEHRTLLTRLAQAVPALAAAHVITGDEVFARKAGDHLRAWFVDADTCMNPHLLYAQAIPGRCHGRGIGIIDTVQLAEVAVAVSALEARATLPGDVLRGTRDWFARFVEWLTTHPYGLDERDEANNHATGWLLQVAAYARFLGSEDLATECRRRFKSILLPGQMAPDGSFPEEIRRTRPYGYSLFNLDLCSAVAQVLSVPGDDLFHYEMADGRGLKRAVEFMVPHVRDPLSWPHPRDVVRADDWPVRHPFLLFAGLAYDDAGCLSLYRRLASDPEDAEIQRNFPVRQPALWVDRQQRAL